MHTKIKSTGENYYFTIMYVKMHYKNGFFLLLNKLILNSIVQYVYTQNVMHFSSVKIKFKAL